MAPNRTKLMLALSALTLPAFVGCKSVSQDQYKALEQEASQLRERNQMVEKQLADAEAEKVRLQQELDTARADAAKVTDVPVGGDGGATSGSPGDRVISIAGDVLFSSGSATIKNDAKRVLDRIADELNSSYASNRIRIAGHSDSTPLRKTKDKWTDNENLSGQRALAVERYLATKGVDAKRMYSAAFGADDPKGSKNASRRVEIVILAQGNS